LFVEPIALIGARRAERYSLMASNEIGYTAEREH
jgi:hypothetical protein